MTLNAEVKLEDIQVSPAEITIGEIIEVSGTFKSNAEVGSIIVLSQQQHDTFRKKAAPDAGLVKKTEGVYSFFIKMETRNADSGEHILRMVVLDPSGIKIDNIMLKRIMMYNAQIIGGL